jgi:hypothetical protein
MRGAIPPLSNTPPWPGAQFKAQGQLYLYLYRAKLISLYFVKYIGRVREMHTALLVGEVEVKTSAFMEG